MKSIIFKVLQYIVFICIGVFFLWWALHGTELTWAKFSDVLQNDINYWWIVLSIVLAFLSNISRAIRWKMMLKPSGHDLSVSNSLNSILVMYFANNAVPRSGEIVRCGVLKRYEKIPISKSFATVIVERLIDLAILALLTVLVWLVQYTQFMKFFNYSFDSKNSTTLLGFCQDHKITSAAALAFVVGIVVLILFWKHIKNLKLYKLIEHKVLEFIEGLKVIMHVENPLMFWMHTILIWVLYFFMLYVNFFAFKFTANFTPIIALTFFVMASYGMVAPTPGGIGPWHFLAIQTLMIYMVPNYNISDFTNKALYVTEKNNASIFAIVVHGVQFVTQIIFGFIAMMLLPILNRKHLKEIENIPDPID